MANHPFLLFGLIGACCAVADRAMADEPLLRLQPGDHVAIVGSGVAERQQHHGWLEALIHRAHPKAELTIRNFGFAGDEVDFRPRSEDVPPIEYFLAMKKGVTAVPGKPEVVYRAGTDFGADVILAYWGFNESFDGPGGLESFKQELGKYLDSLLQARFNGESAPRVVLFSPLAHENLKSPDFPDGEANNVNLALYSGAMAEIAAAKKVSFINLFVLSREAFAKASTPLTINGIHLSESGDQQLAALQFKQLFGEAPPAMSDSQSAKIRSAVLAKNTEWHRRYRSVDQYNIYGGRSRGSYEGITNAVTLGEEMAQRDVKTANRDRRVWAVAQGRDLVVTDNNLPPVGIVPPNRKEEPGYLGGEETIPHLKLAAGCKIELVASEETFPELVNPVQMNFDTKGRLWVAAWPTYPEATPTAKVFDKLLVIDLDPKTGKAAKITTFADGLNCPTGFQFYRDGVLVMQAPDLWFLRDTDGDGKADTRERMLHGIDSADSHHTSNSICLEPGGAVYLSDGVFHRSSVETITGPVRNIDGAIYRYEPRTSKFMRHAPYGFANPHGRVFDYWGNDLITDATGNANYFGPAMSGHLDSGKHAGMEQFWDRPSRPTPGTWLLSSRHFPDDWQGEFLNANVIGVQGIFRAKLTEEGSGIKGETLEHLVAADLAKAPNFRPSGITVAPDGSLYLMDWAQMLIGHLQHHLRDPNRDHQHGRIYRITYEGRPLLVPKKIDGAPLADLLECLKEPENDVRTRAKIELGKRDTPEVIRGVRDWISLLDPKDAAFEHHLLEALWVHQWHNVVDLELLQRVLKSPEPRARAQAVRVLGYWRDRVPDGLAWLKSAASDEAPRVRLEVARVASFYRQWEAVDVALRVQQQPTDYYIDYCVKETLRQLKPWMKEALAQREAMNETELSAALVRADATLAQRAEALAELAKMKKRTAAAVLLDPTLALTKQTGKSLDELCQLLVKQPTADLKACRPLLKAMAAASNPPVLRQAAIAATITADGGIGSAWDESAKSPVARVDFLEALLRVNDPALRASAYDKVLPLLAASGPEADAAGVRRAAIAALSTMGCEPQKTFDALVALMESGQEIPASAAAVNKIQSVVWSKPQASAVVKSLIAWAGKASVKDRTSADYRAVERVAEAAAAQLPTAEAAAARQVFADLQVPTYMIKAVPEQLRFDTKRLVIAAGKPFQVVFENPDALPHNLVFVQPDTAQAVATAVQTQLPTQLDAQGRAYLPEGDTRIWGATKLLEAGQKEALILTAPADEGSYEFVCTFPGHWAIMRGTVIVTKNVEAYLKANPEPAAAQ